jgi:hypothetical protein
MTTALEGGEWSAAHPGLTLPQGPSGQVQKILPPPGFDPRTVQSIVSRYTDLSYPAHRYIYIRIHMHIYIYIYWGAGGGAGQSLPYPMLAQYRKFNALILEYSELYFNIVLTFMAKGHRNAAWSQLYSKQTASRI